MRERLIDAVVAVAGDFGYAGTSVDRIVREAEVTPADFEAEFGDLETALAAAYQSLFDRYLDRLLRTCEVQSSWPLKVRVGIAVTLDMAAASPVAARFLVETMLGATAFPGEILDSRDRLARLLVPGRTETPHGGELPGIVESVLVGGVVGVISAQLRIGEAKQLPGLAPSLVELVLLPYLGREQASEVARRPRPAA